MLGAMKIRPRRNREGVITSYQADFGVVDGRRVQESFKTAGLAEAALRDARASQKRHGVAGALVSPQEMAEFLHLKEKVSGLGVSFLQVVAFYQQHGDVVKERVLVPDLVQRYLDAKWEEEKSERYRQQLKVSLGGLSKCLALRAASEVTREEVEGWVRGNGWQPKTRNNYLGDARALFKWAVREKYVARNPCEGIAKARQFEKEIVTLSVTQCAALLKAALKDRRFLGYVALGMFGGIRRAELERMSWEAVDLKGGTVIVAGASAKTRRRRVVDLSENARRWLALVADRKGAICVVNFGDRWLEFRKRYGFPEWPPNALRHTFASMHYAFHQNEALLQAQMGHENAAMLHRHYRALKTRAEAGKFWKLRPVGKLA